MNECVPIKKGKYFYYAPNGGIVTVVRKRKKQIERYNNENQKFIFNIYQINSCNFELTLSKTKGVDKIQKSKILGKKVKVTILSSDLNEYQLVLKENNDLTKNSLILYKN